MIVKTRHGYQVLSEKRKTIIKDNLTFKQAEERLKQVEIFKHMQKKKTGEGPYFA